MTAIYVRGVAERLVVTVVGDLIPKGFGLSQFQDPGCGWKVTCSYSRVRIVMAWNRTSFG